MVKKVTNEDIVMLLNEGVWSTPFTMRTLKALFPTRRKRRGKIRNCTHMKKMIYWSGIRMAQDVIWRPTRLLLLRKRQFKCGKSSLIPMDNLKKTTLKKRQGSFVANHISILSPISGEFVVPGKEY